MKRYVESLYVGMIIILPICAWNATKSQKPFTESYLKPKILQLLIKTVDYNGRSNPTRRNVEEKSLCRNMWKRTMARNVEMEKRSQSILFVQYFM